MSLARDHDNAADRSYRLRKRLGRVLRRVFGLLVLAGLAAYIYGLCLFTSGLLNPPEIKVPQSDAIVALTGGSSRIAEAVSLLTDGKGRRLLITGVNREVNKAELLKLFPTAAPFMECCIDLDYRALNTRGNAVETGKWVSSNGFGSVTVVTSDYHLPRALVELKEVLPPVRLVGLPVRSSLFQSPDWWTNAASFKLIVWEYSKYVMALVAVQADRLWSGTS